MPIFEFTCKACGEKFDHLHRSIKDEPKAKCPKCGSPKTARALSLIAVNTNGGEDAGPSGGGHVHSGMCGCGRKPGTCG